jgi:hypothetical protein
LRIFDKIEKGKDIPLLGGYSSFLKDSSRFPPFHAHKSGQGEEGVLQILCFNGGVGGHLRAVGVL